MPAEGSVDKNRDGVNVALVQHAQHDVDRHQRRQNQDRLRRERVLESGRRPLEAAVDAGRHPHISLRLIDGARCRTQIASRRKVERKRHRRELSLVIDGQRRG